MRKGGKFSGAKTGRVQRALRRLMLFLAAVLILFSCTGSASALSQGLRKRYAQNRIIYYNPEEEEQADCNFLFIFDIDGTLDTTARYTDPEQIYDGVVDAFAWMEANNIDYKIMTAREGNHYNKGKQWVQSEILDQITTSKTADDIFFPSTEATDKAEKAKAAGATIVFEDKRETVEDVASKGMQAVNVILPSGSNRVEGENIYHLNASYANFVDVVEEATANAGMAVSECTCASTGASGGGYNGACAELRGQQLAWVEQQYPIMHSIMDNARIPWEVPLAQSISESTSGTSPLFRDCNNIGGMKHHPNDTQHVACPGHERYNKYNTVADSWRHYTTGYTISVGAGIGIMDPYENLRVIWEHGYAEDPDYVQKVAPLICAIQEWARNTGKPINEGSGSGGSSSSSGSSTAADDDDDDEGEGTAAAPGTVSGGWVTYPGISKAEPDSSKIEFPRNSRSFTPKFIVLHSTEGGSVGSNGLDIYNVDQRDTRRYGDVSSSSVIHPAHFTVDLENKKGYQHFPLNELSNAVADVDGYGAVQIEIVGYASGTGAHHLQSYGDEEWDYLAGLLATISEATGIPLTTSCDWTGPTCEGVGNRFGAPGKLTNWPAGTVLHAATYESDLEAILTQEQKDAVQKLSNYSGVLGHQHLPLNDHPDPGNIWHFIEDALNRGNYATGSTTSGGASASGGASTGCGMSGNVGSLQQLIREWAWPDYSNPQLDRMPAYANYIDNVATYTGYTASNGAKGIDCGAFVANLMVASGWDPNYVQGYTVEQRNYLAANWTRLGSGSEISESDLQPGDVAIRDGHVFVYAGDIPGFNSKIASASMRTDTSAGRAPMAGHERINDSRLTWYRRP